MQGGQLPTNAKLKHLLIHLVYCCLSLPIDVFTQPLETPITIMEKYTTFGRRTKDTERSSAFVHQHGGDDFTQTRPSSSKT